MNHTTYLSFEKLYSEIGHDSEVMVKVGREWLTIRFQFRLGNQFHLKITKPNGESYFIDVKSSAIFTKADFPSLEYYAEIQYKWRTAKECRRYLAD